jgi:hypothetical protein
MKLQSIYSATIIACNWILTSLATLHLHRLLSTIGFPWIICSVDQFCFFQLILWFLWFLAQIFAVCEYCIYLAIGTAVIHHRHCWWLFVCAIKILFDGQFKYITATVSNTVRRRWYTFYRPGFTIVKLELSILRLPHTYKKRWGMIEIDDSFTHTSSLCQSLMTWVSHN